MSELSVKLNAIASTSAIADPSVESVIADKQLMQKVANGDEAALAELFSQHGEMLAQLVGRLTGWHADADDILQEVLLKIWQSADSYHGKGSLEGWLKRVAVNRCRNHFRSLGAFNRLVQRFGKWIQLQNKTTNSVYPAEENTQLQLSLQHLSHDDRTVLVLFYLEEMPGNEVAEVLGIKSETLHVRLHRARKKLKRLLETEGEESA